jgi:hypothetical protein
MGKPNIVTKRYMQDNARFADICNFYMFNGQQVIVPDEIEDFDKFKTEMGPLMEFINSAASGKKFTNAFETKRTRWENLSNEAIDLLNICLDAKLEIEKDLEKGMDYRKISVVCPEND